MFFSSKRLHVEGKALRHFKPGTKYDIDSKRLPPKPFGSLIATCSGNVYRSGRLTLPEKLE